MSAPYPARSLAAARHRLRLRPSHTDLAWSNRLRSLRSLWRLFHARRIAMLALFWIGLAAAAQDETGFAVAPELHAFERFAPQVHRVLMDGTYDTFTREERFEFLVKNLKEIGKGHPAAESAIRNMVEEVEAHREALRGDAKRLAEVDARENEEILALLLEINSALMTVEQHMGSDAEPDVLFEWEQ